MSYNINGKQHFTGTEKAVMATSDREIRREICNSLIKKYGKDPGTLIVHELKVCQGEARIDIALVNGALHGYEIKSDRDTLERLPGQIKIYNRVFDTITIVTGASHLKEVATLIPPWWGIKVATRMNSGEIAITDMRQPESNTNVDAFSLAQFLWRDELLDLLMRHNVGKEIKRLTRSKLWAYVAENISLEELKAHVRDCLKKRQAWRPDVLRT
ncbi:sce7726 family protein [Thermanaeromonas toyohensis]|nr:sce7726 family protein [Thermanaeromonas toyohensis]